MVKVIRDSCLVEQGINCARVTWLREEVVDLVLKGCDHNSGQSYILYDGLPEITITIKGNSERRVKEILYNFNRLEKFCIILSLSLFKLLELLTIQYT